MDDDSIRSDGHNTRSIERFAPYRCCVCFDIHIGLSMLSAFMCTAGVVLFIVGIELTKRGPPPDGPSTFTIVVICTIGFGYAFSGWYALSTLYEHAMLSAKSTRRRLRAIGLKNIASIKQICYVLATSGIIYFVHTIVEVAHGNPTFGAKEWIRTIILSGLALYWGYVVRRYCIHEEEACAEQPRTRDASLASSSTHSAIRHSLLKESTENNNPYTTTIIEP